MRKPLTAQDVAWIRRQLEHPNPVHLVAELVRLCGPHMTHRRLRKMLIRKGVIDRTSRKGRDHLIMRSRLMAMWPELWTSVRRSWDESGKLAGDEPEDLDEAG